MKSKKALSLTAVLMLIALLLPFYIPSTIGDLPHAPPYYWLVKITQTEPVIANVTFQLTLGGTPINLVEVIPMTPGVTQISASEVELYCEYEPPAGVAAAVIVTLAIPNDIHLSFAIDWDGDTIVDQAYSCCYYDLTTQPPFTIPFHWEMDGPQVPLAPPLLVTFDLEPLPVLPEVQEDEYVVMGGITDSCGQLGGRPAWHRGYWNPLIGAGVPFATRPPNLTPGYGQFNITFSAVDPQTGVVYLTVPRDSARFDPTLGSYIIFDHTYYSPRPPLPSWFRVVQILAQDGYGWLFTGKGTDPINPDVDIITTDRYKFEVDQPMCGMNTSATFWASFPNWGLSSPMGAGNSTFCATRGGFPDVGLDLIPGTADDGFGNGVPDGAGASVLFLPVKLLVLYDEDGTEPWIWAPLFAAPFPAVLTTEWAMDCTDEPLSLIDGCPYDSVDPYVPTPHGQPLNGMPWQFLNYTGEWGENKHKSLVQYVCQWSVLRIWTALGWLDVNYDSVMTLAKREHYTYCTGDVDLAGLAVTPPFLKVDMMDISMGCYAAFTYDELLAPPIETRIAHPRFDARCDVDMNGVVDMMDISLQCYNFLHEYGDP